MVEITQADGQPFPAMPEHISSLHFAGKEHRIRKPADFFRIADRHRKFAVTEQQKAPPII